MTLARAGDTEVELRERNRGLGPGHALEKRNGACELAVLDRDDGIVQLVRDLNAILRVNAARRAAAGAAHVTEPCEPAGALGIRRRGRRCAAGCAAHEGLEFRREAIHDAAARRRQVLCRAGIRNGVVQLRTQRARTGIDRFSTTRAGSGPTRNAGIPFRHRRDDRPSPSAWSGRSVAPCIAAGGRAPSASEWFGAEVWTARLTPLTTAASRDEERRVRNVVGTKRAVRRFAVVARDFA